VIDLSSERLLPLADVPEFLHTMKAIQPEDIYAVIYRDECSLDEIVVRLLTRHGRHKYLDADALQAAREIENEVRNAVWDGVHKGLLALTPRRRVQRAKQEEQKS